jgi:hypothetical protein
MADPYNITVDDILTGRNTGQSVSEMVDQIFQMGPAGSFDTAIGNTIFGLNHRQQPPAILNNRDHYGYTFFTRPRMNMTDENLRTQRRFGPLLTQVDYSLQRAIRCTLDPDLAWADNPVSCSLIDRQQAFIPILSNTLLSMTGWPDLEAMTFTAHEGIYKESFSIVDSVVDRYETYDITANFRNMPGDPITLLFLTWLYYESYVYLGEIVPYPDMLINNEIDYQTRIYRLVMDPDKRRVQGIAACGAAFPTTCPIGAKFNFESDQPLNKNMDQISITFRCAGAMYNDDILIDEFNRTQGLFNSHMNPSNFSGFGQNTRNLTGYRMLQLNELELFNNAGYPRIDPVTYELQWWIDSQTYQRMLPFLTYQQGLTTHLASPTR